MGDLLDVERARALARIDRISELMDSRYRIPIVNVRVGWDAIGGLVPVAGDVATAGIAVWLMLEARRFEADARLLTRMAGNVAVDVLISSIPVIGSVLDVFFRANDRNFQLLLRHIEDDLAAKKARGRAYRRRKGIRNEAQK